MWPSIKHQDLKQYHRTQNERLANYEAALSTGQYRPFIYPWDSLPALYLLLALLIFPRLPRGYAKVARWPTLILILTHCIYVVYSCRTVGFAGGYGIGLSATWGCIMTFALLFFNNFDTDFRRLEARRLAREDEQDHVPHGSTTSASFHVNDCEVQGKARERNRQNEKRTGKQAASPVTAATATPYQLAWQPYPSTLAHRLDWTMDLLTCFRGVNWNFRDPTLSKLAVSSDHVTEDTGNTAKASNSDSISKVRRRAVTAFIRLYLTLDLLKFILAADPYFYGSLPIGSVSPTAIYSTSSSSMVKLLRLILTAASVYTTLNLIFQLCPIFFTTIPLLLPYPSVLSITRTPLLTPSMYEPYWGPLFPSIASKGLTGFWGRFWHQLFRWGISQPSAYIIKRYSLDSRSDEARLIQVLTAFAFSGSIHALASYTSSPPTPGSTHPVTGAWSFFMLQGVGILLQSYLTRAIRSRSFPVWLRQAGNIFVVLAWAWITGPLLADDFARCGVWLFEPLPISFTRGIYGHGWWRWGGRWAGWWSDPDGKWWKSGLAVY